MRNSRQLVFLFAFFVPLSAIGVSASGPPDSKILRPNHISCTSEDDVGRLASIDVEADFRSTAIQLINSGRCAIAANAVKIVDMSVKSNAGGFPYYCFHRVEYEFDELALTEVVVPAVECSIGRFITTLRQQVAERTGDFNVVGKGSFGAAAVCSEGGRVSLRFQNGRVFRTAYVLPGVFQPDIPAEADIETAFRNGCKGVDSIK